MLEKSEKRKQDRHETCNELTSKRFEWGPRSKGEAKGQRREGQGRILTLKGRFLDHFGVVFGPWRVDFGSQKWVEKVEGKKVEKKWPKGPTTIIDNSICGAQGSLGNKVPSTN